MNNLNKNLILLFLVISSLSLQACKNENRSPVVPPPTAGQGGDDGSRSFSDQDGGVGEVSTAVFSDDQVVQGSTADATSILSLLEEIGLIFINTDEGVVRAFYTEEVETELSREELLLNDIDRLSLMIELFEELKITEDVEDSVLVAVSSVQESTEIRLELLMSFLDQDEQTYDDEEVSDPEAQEVIIDEVDIIQRPPLEDGSDRIDTDIKLRQ